MFQFMITVDCPECDEEVLYGPVATVLEDEDSGLPVVPYDIAATTAFHCSACNHGFGTGDFELYES